jgi:hypothetical protein
VRIFLAPQGPVDGARPRRKRIVIVFDLTCDSKHRFEGWFASGEDFDRQLAHKMLSCPVCGSGKIVRVPHALRIGSGSREQAQPQPPATDGPQHYANLGNEVIAKLIDHIIETTEDVGAAFPEEARKIHYREAPERRIRGTASKKEVEALTDEGIEVAALPLPLHRLRKAH